jgi:RHS repeat-associated protein
VSEGNQVNVFYINKYSELRDGVLIKYVYAGLNKIALLDGSETTPSAFFLHDHLGSNSIALNPEGMVAEYMAYYPYGHRRLIHSSHQEKVHANYQFIGKEHEEESGLYYFEARWQDPVTGRFLSTDPVERGFNVYAYANNNPMSYVDTDGEFAWVPILGFALGYASNALATNDWSFENNIVPGLIGAAVGSVGYLAGGSELSAKIGLFENLGHGMMSGAASMATSDLLTYSFYTNNWNFHDFMRAGISGATQGAFFGAASAGITYGLTKGIDFFSDVLNSSSPLDKEATFENTFGKIPVCKGCDNTLNDLARVPTKSYHMIKDGELKLITYKTDTFLNRCLRWPIKSVIKPAIEWSLGIPDTYRGILEKWGYHTLTQIATNRNIHEFINNKNWLVQINKKPTDLYKVKF